MTAALEREPMPAVLMPGQLPIPRWAALFSLCDVVISPDTGSLHLAVALGGNQIENLGTANGLFNFELKNTENQTILLQDLLKTGTIRTFNEKIPSMNEVFINAVKS